MNLNVRVVLASAALIALASWTGCGDGNGDGNGDLSLDKRGELQVLEPVDEIVSVDIGIIEVGDSNSFTVRAQNNGQGPLNISSVSLIYNAPDAGDSLGDAFVLETVETPVILQVNEGEVSFNVVFKRQETFENRSATLRITSDSRPRADGKKLDVYDIVFLENAPQAVAIVQPNDIDFETVTLGTVGEKTVNVASTGSDQLCCHAFSLSGHPDFTFHHPDTEKAYPVSDVTSTKVDLDEPFCIEPDETQNVRITFTPQTNTPANGTFILYCNDLKLEGHSVLLKANNEVPCVHVVPSEITFGGKIVATKAELPVEISNCGTSKLKISDIRLAEDSDPDFKLVFKSEGVPSPKPFDPTAPLVVPINEHYEVFVQYVPDVVSPLDADNKPIPDTATLIVDNNSFETSVQVPISGTGVEVDCPVAIINVEEGEQVVPQTTLHLKGDQSYSPNGLNIKNWEWSVEQPNGSTSIFIPSATHDNPVFTVNVSGIYKFCLTVRDDSNEESCEEACIDVVVIPDEAIHVELTWTTVGDADPNDIGEGKGTDMDLHFTHPFATGPDIDGDGEADPWFDENYDCFWFYKTHNWGTFAPDVDDDPHLDLDDIDGWGPENLNLNIPENVVYKVGVNFWNDHKFGESLASVYIYVYGELVESKEDVLLVNHDMWYAATIDWQPGNVITTILTTEEGDMRITPNYVNANFLPPIDGGN